MGRSSTVLGSCASCKTAIFDDHPYAWCDRCGATLPDELKATLHRLHPPAPPPRETGEPLVVDGREVPCPICQHRHFRTREAVMGGRAAAFFNVEWASTSARTYICTRCGHVLWFMR